MSSTESQLPPGWTWTTVADLTDVGSGLTKNAKKRSASSSRVPLVTVAAVGFRHIDPEEFGSIKLLEADSDKGTLHAGDILVVEGNGSKKHIGRVAVWDLDLPEARHQNHLIRLRPEGGFQSEYLLEWLASPGGRERLIEEATTAAGLFNLSLSKVSRIQVPLAPKRERENIVTKIDALQARSRRAREALDAIPDLLDRFRQSVLAAAFRGDLTADWRAKHPDVEPASVLLERIRAERKARWIEAEAERVRARAEAKAVKAGKPWGVEQDAKALAAGKKTAEKKYKAPEPVDAEAEGLHELPEGWCWAPVELLNDPVRPICYGVVQPGPEVEGGTTLIRVCDLVDGGVDLAASRTIGPTVDAQYERSRLTGSEVLVSLVGTIGRVAVAPQAAAGANLARAVARIAVLDPLVAPRWVAAWLSAPTMQQRMLSEAREVARKTLNLADLRTAVVPLAPATEMEHVLETIDTALSTLPNSKAIEICKGRLDTLDQAILAKAFRGELVPQDRADEPASALLERIRAERAATATDGRKRRRR